MTVLIGIALKSLLIAGLTLGLLQLMRHRSAAERSWVAHIGLLALVIMAFAPLLLPSWKVEAPALFATKSVAPAVVQATAPMQAAPALLPVANAAKAAVTPAATPALPSLSPVAAATALYAVPAAILLFITLLALVRLITLRARADVLVDGHWLSALARAQRRMGFKHGTALLTSNELASPISWGLMRPVILLNSRAVEAADEAEAIIAHELAHVARMDWIKLLLARIATALFWFNPLVWVLAREAHQLREETADDTVLAADIDDTDYAQLLVGVARHECPGLLLGAHGVAPSKSSLARRVARVLDGKSVRGPVARSFALGVLSGAVLVAAPLAALTVTPATPKAPKVSGAVAASEPTSVEYPLGRDTPADLPSLIAKGVSTSVATAAAAIVPAAPVAPVTSAAAEAPFRVVAPTGASVESVDGKMVSRSPSGATVTVYPADAHGRRKMVSRAPNGATVVTYVDADDVRARAERQRRHDPTIVRIIELKAVGVTPEYIGAMRAAVPHLSALDFRDFTGMRAVGVTPEYARALVAAGFPSITADELVEARAVGVTGDYVRSMRSAGVRGDLEDFVQLRAVGVDPAFAARVKASGVKVSDPDDLVELRALGVTKPPAPPRTPPAPRAPDPNPDG
jgi:beta-lactamase regulating signal transducer with metallopeptidase domain